MVARNKLQYDNTARILGSSHSSVSFDGAWARDANAVSIGGINESAMAWFPATFPAYGGHGIIVHISIADDDAIFLKIKSGTSAHLHTANEIMTWWHKNYATMCSAGIERFLERCSVFG